MVQLRWYATTNIQRKLQYRQKIDKTMRGDNTVVYQTPFPQVPPMENWEWSEWKDVPEVFEQ